MNSLFIIEISFFFKQEVLDNPVYPVLVDFWAPWCGPRMVGPVVDEIAEEYSELIKVKINTDENPSVVTEYSIRSIPTYNLMIFKSGKRVDTVIGAVPKSTLATTLEKYIN
uniref:thioredoxin n=1 Tax=Madagascaria erythrocladioides TaxID=753684 RepID=UPI001FCCEFEA|nr:thioredoxin [Madagascaria erythrocladioides]UNJ16619.1 thioredoxin [Madagascaria erythrocladioides]